MSNSWDGKCLNHDDDDGDDDDDDMDDDVVDDDVPLGCVVQRWCVAVCFGVDDDVPLGCVIQRWCVAFCFGSGVAHGRRCASDVASPLLA